MHGDVTLTVGLETSLVILNNYLFPRSWLISNLHTLLRLVVNAVNRPGVEDVLPAERPHDDVGAFQIS